MNLEKTSVLSLMFLLALASVAYCGESAIVVDQSIPSVDVYCPAGGAKLPAVFFAHNGGAKKEDWADYPQKLAGSGYLAASIGWTNFAGSDDLEASIDAVLKKYADRIDASRVAFIGGCHGGVKMVSLMNAGSDKYQLKTVVFLSVSELAEPSADHVPILGIYATEDRLGNYYKDFTKKYVETILTEPKKTFAYAGAPHGNELVADAGSKESVRREIDAWLREKL